MASDQELRARVASNKAKRKRYEKARNGIANNGLSTNRSLESLEGYIEHCKKTISYITENETGYHYLSEFKEKMSEDVKTLEEYKKFAKDSNAAFIKLYNKLGEEIESLTESIAQDIAAHNKGKINPFEIIWF